MNSRRERDPVLRILGADLGARRLPEGASGRRRSRARRRAPRRARAVRLPPVPRLRDPRRPEADEGARSRARSRRGPTKGINVKLGRGGIREVEFVIQSLQLIHAGQGRAHPRAQLARGARALRRGALPRRPTRASGSPTRTASSATSSTRSSSSTSVRRRSSRRATARSSWRAGSAIVRRTRRSRSASFATIAERHMDAVAASFAALFYGAEAGRAESDDGRSATLLAESRRRSGARPRPRSRRSGSSIRARRAITSCCCATVRRRRARTRAGSNYCSRSRRHCSARSRARPIRIWRSATSPASSPPSVRGRASSRCSPRTRRRCRVLVRLFGSSEFLSQILIRHPEMLDNLVRADLVRLEHVRRTRSRPSSRASIAAADGYEARLDALRRFRNEQFLRIGINDLDNLLLVPRRQQSAERSRRRLPRRRLARGGGRRPAGATGSRRRRDASPWSGSASSARASSPTIPTST